MHLTKDIPKGKCTKHCYVLWALRKQLAVLKNGYNLDSLSLLVRRQCCLTFTVVFTKNKSANSMNVFYIIINLSTWTLTVYISAVSIQIMQKTCSIPISKHRQSNLIIYVYDSIWHRCTILLYVLVLTRGTQQWRETFLYQCTHILVEFNFIQTYYICLWSNFIQTSHFCHSILYRYSLFVWDSGLYTAIKSIHQIVLRFSFISLQQIASFIPCNYG